MSDIVLTGDHYILLSATLVIGITIVYAIRKWLSHSDNTSNKQIKEFAKSSPDLVCKQDINDNHYQNGNAIKVAESDNQLKNNNNNNKLHISVNNNDSEESEVSEELIISETFANPVIKELLISDNSVNDCYITSTDSVDKNCVNEVIVETKYQELHEANDNTFADNVSDLAAIILTNDRRKNWCEIVCITTGSDVIDAQNLEPEFVVIDSRAPVLTRRCLIRYLYQKLNELINNEVTEEESIFGTIPASNRFEVKKCFKFSLYLSKPPDNWRDRSRADNQSAAAGQVVRLKSTTDKIGVWNQVGVQGSLLSHFLDTIYINSVITGTDFNERLFHQHFVLNYTKEPKLMKCEKPLIDDIMKKINGFRVRDGYNGRKIATNWIHTEEGLEFIDCRTGKAIVMSGDQMGEQLSTSRLSKHSLHKCFRDFVSNYEYNVRHNQSLTMTYRKWKESAPNYRIQKQLLKVRYAVAGKQWLTLSSDLDTFV